MKLLDLLHHLLLALLGMLDVIIEKDGLKRFGALLFLLSNSAFNFLRLLEDVLALIHIKLRIVQSSLTNRL